jgi:hypothetical protein
MPGKTFVCKDIKKKSMDFKGNYSDNKLWKYKKNQYNHIF